jgi:hypothetical protein
MKSILLRKLCRAKWGQRVDESARVVMLLFLAVFQAFNLGYSCIVTLHPCGTSEADANLFAGIIAAQISLSGKPSINLGWNTDAAYNILKVAIPQ